MSKRMLVLMCSIMLIVPLFFMGCSGDDGAAGTNGTNGTDGTNGKDLTAVATPESCAICHNGAAEADGTAHQDSYDALYQDNVIVIKNLTYAFVNDNTDQVTFTMEKAGVPLACTGKSVNVNIYFAPYDNATGRFQFVPARDRQSLKGAHETPVDNVLTGDITALNGLCTSTKPSVDNVSLAAKNGYIVVYGYDEQVGSIAARVKQVKYPYASLLKEGTVDFVPPSNVKGCEKCHTVPYLKHGNIYGRVDKDAATDMITCKACHLDNGPGGHFIWQMLVDDTPRAAVVWAEAKAAEKDPEDFMTAAEKTKYAYKTRLMNDVHMSHAMEFEYPQSMSTCNTCHEGKLTQILTDANFTQETCLSCHAYTGSKTATGAPLFKNQPSLKTIWKDAGVDTFAFHTLNGTACNNAGCHVSGGAPVFSQIHTGYDKKIYTDNGVKYSTAITVTINDNVTLVGNVLTWKFSAAGTAGGLGAANIAPTVMVGQYAWDTKDFLGTLSSSSQTVDNVSGNWTATADLTAWAADIASGKTKRVELAVRPVLKNAAGTPFALNAVSKTFNLATKKVVTSDNIALVNKCNNCHDALSTTFHTSSLDRGGSIVVCRMCHIPGRGGSHLEMASRSIDSYAHAIHSFQAFDFDRVNFDNAVQSMFYDLKTESTFPTFGLTNCEACHAEGKFNVPVQSKSLPGVLSPSDNNATSDRSIVDGESVPWYITGPASRACGGCHRAELIKEATVNQDAAVELAAFNSHTRTNGYLLETTSGTYAADFNAAVLRIMGNFEDGIVLPTP